MPYCTSRQNNIEPKENEMDNTGHFIWVKYIYIFHPPVEKYSLEN